MPKSEYKGIEIQTTFLPELIQNDPNNKERTNLCMSAWASLYSMTIIQKHKWRFVSEREIISEDYYSLLYLYRYVEKIAVLKAACYFYCENQGSLTHVFQKNRYEKIILSYLKFLNSIISMLSAYFIYIFINLILHLLSTTLRIGYR